MNTNEDCLAYAEHLQLEHRELHERVRRMQGEVNNISANLIDAPMLARMIEAGQRLRCDLSEHFREEDSGGCMDYACSRVPALAAEAQALEHEHPALLAQLDQLVNKLLVAKPNELSVAQIKQQFDTFVVKLLSHEARENRVVQRGFNLELE